MFQSTRPRGARRARSSGVDNVRCFNPRARVGRDFCTTSAITQPAAFQSTRPRGARRPTKPRCWPWPSFNPRARVGRDRGPQARAADVHGFNPRARVGRDPTITWPRPIVTQFQSTRPRGARPAPARSQGLPRRVSIHAPAWGATRWPPACRCPPAVSIHAPAWGATG